MQDPNLIESEFTEEDFISGLETSLSQMWHAPWPLEITRISQDAERKLGYDGILTSLIPFYIQAKRITLCRPTFSGMTTTQRNSLGLETKRGYYRFALHRDRGTGEFVQHNVLFQLTQSQNAAYVAPLFYKRDDLTRFKRLSGQFPWTYRDLILHDTELPVHASMRTRFFHQCISILPHKLIDDSSPTHYYSFLRDGQLCFHSEPEKPTNALISLSDFLQSIIDKADRAKPDGYSAAWIMQLLPKLYDTTWRGRWFKTRVREFLIELGLFPSGNPVAIERFVIAELANTEQYLLAEVMLKHDFNITQYMIKQFR